MKNFLFFCFVFQNLNFIILFISLVRGLNFQLREKFYFRRHFNSTNQIPYNSLEVSQLQSNTCFPAVDRGVTFTTENYTPVHSRSPLHFVVTYPHYLDCCCSEPEDCVPSSPRSVADPRFEPSYPRVYSRGLCSWRNGKPRDTVNSRNSIIRSRC